jgi:hypothetical protein
MKTNMVGIYFVLWTVVILPSLIAASPLDEYVYTLDPYYHFTEISATKGPGYTLYLYTMTSLKWKSGILCSIQSSQWGGGMFPIINT